MLVVPKVVEIADPLIKTSLTTYGSVHDTVVVSFPSIYSADVKQALPEYADVCQQQVCM